MKNIKINKKKSLKDRYDGETAVEALVLNRTTKTKHLPDIDLSSYNNNEAYEILTTAVEHYLLRGLTNPHRLAKTLGHNVTSVKAAIKRVHLRWSVSQNTKKDMVRGKTLAIYDNIMAEGFNLLEKGDNTKDKLSALRLLSDVNTKISELTGIKAVEGVGQTNIAIINGDSKRANIQLIQQKFNDLLNNTGVSTLENTNNKTLDNDLDTIPLLVNNQAESVILDQPMEIPSVSTFTTIESQEENEKDVNYYIGDSLKIIPESSISGDFQNSEENKPVRTRRKRPSKS